MRSEDSFTHSGSSFLIPQSSVLSLQSSAFIGFETMKFLKKLKKSSPAAGHNMCKPVCRLEIFFREVVNVKLETWKITKQIFKQ